MRSYIETEPNNLRETFRRPDGRFGHADLAEVHIDLDVTAAPFDHQDHQDEVTADDARPDLMPAADIDIEQMVKQWSERLGLPSPRQGDAAGDLEDAGDGVEPGLDELIEQERQSRALAQLEPDPTAETPAEAEKRSWHRRFLDMVMPRMAPLGHFTLRRTMKTALTKGVVLMASIVAFAVPSHVVGAYMRVEPGREESTQVDPTAVRLTELSTRYDCYTSGLGEGEIPAHAIIKVIKKDGTKLRVVTFDKGWAAHMDKTDNQVLAAVCRD